MSVCTFCDVLDVVLRFCPVPLRLGACSDDSTAGNVCGKPGQGWETVCLTAMNPLPASATPSPRTGRKPSPTKHKCCSRRWETDNLKSSGDIWKIWALTLSLLESAARLLTPSACTPRTSISLNALRVNGQAPKVPKAFSFTLPSSRFELSKSNCSILTSSNADSQGTHGRQVDTSNRSTRTEEVRMSPGDTSRKMSPGMVCQGVCWSPPKLSPLSCWFVFSFKWLPLDTVVS